LARVRKEELESFQERYESLQRTEAGLHEDIGSLKYDSAGYKHRQATLTEELHALKIEQSALKQVQAEHTSCADDKAAFDQQINVKDSTIESLTRNSVTRKHGLKDLWISFLLHS